MFTRLKAGAKSAARYGKSAVKKVRNRASSKKYGVPARGLRNNSNVGVKSNTPKMQSMQIKVNKNSTIPELEKVIYFLKLSLNAMNRKERNGGQVNATGRATTKRVLAMAENYLSKKRNQTKPNAPKMQSMQIKVNKNSTIPELEKVIYFLKLSLNAMNRKERNGGQVNATGRATTKRVLAMAENYLSKKRNANANGKTNKSPVYKNKPNRALNKNSNNK